mgnify:CR=1 FL=1
MTLGSVVECVHCHWIGQVAKCIKIDDPKDPDNYGLYYCSECKRHVLVIDNKHLQGSYLDLGAAILIKY